MAVRVSADLDAGRNELSNLGPCQRLYGSAPQLPEPLPYGGIAVNQSGGDENGCRHSILLEERQRESVVVGVPVIEGDRDDRLRALGRASGLEYGAEWNHLACVREP